jgi:hypothetical protein
MSGMREVHSEPRLPARVVAAMMMGLSFGHAPRIRRPRNRMQNCTSCGKLTRGGGKCFTCETKTRATVTVGLWLILISTLCAGPYEASHRIACQSGNGTSYGSGTAISDRHVVTNSHVVEHRAGQHVSVFNALGSHRGYVIAADPTVDLAIISVAAGGLQPVEIAESDPKAGDQVTIWGYGRQGILRSGEATVQPIKGYRTQGCPVVETDRGIEPGDSGGGMFDADGRLVAVQWCSDGCNGNGAGRSGATPVSCLYALTSKWETQCGNGQCLPWSRRGGGVIICGGIGIGGYGYSQPARPLVPVQPPAKPLQPVQPSAPIAQQPQPKPVQPPTQQPAAPASPPAKACECDQQAMIARLDQQQQATDAIRVRIEALAAEFKTLAGRRACECGPQVPAPTHERHIVIVASQSASTWPRLSGEIERAKQAYSGIRVADPPAFAVPLPQIVAYEDGVPVKVIQGQRNVSEALSRVARGDVFFFPGE